MINFLARIGKKAGWTLFALLLLSLVAPNQGQGATKYKKSTTVDFDEALIEGKSRKPYSAYLYQQQNASPDALAAWDLDFKKRSAMSRSKFENPL
jgi:hypothetical protein